MTWQHDVLIWQLLLQGSLSLAYFPHSRTMLNARRDASLTLDQKQAIMCYLKEHVPIQLSPDQMAGHAPFPTCAVVSSSGAMNLHSYGSDIDSHAAVMRFNDAPVSGYELTVGNKETLRVVNQDGFDRLSSVNSATLYVWTGETGDSSQVITRNPDAQAYDLPPDASGHAQAALEEIYSGRWFNMGTLPGQSMTPTTGFMGMLVALNVCDTVDAYEMTMSSSSSSVPFHYYASGENGINADDNSWHKTFEAENDLWTRIASNSEDEILSSGKASLQGFSGLDCDGVEAVEQVLHVVPGNKALSKEA